MAIVACAALYQDLAGQLGQRDARGSGRDYYHGHARTIYLTVIREGWTSKLSHATYLGKELAKAELSTVQGFQCVQDGA